MSYAREITIRIDKYIWGYLHKIHIYRLIQSQHYKEGAISILFPIQENGNTGWQLVRGHAGSRKAWMSSRLKWEVKWRSEGWRGQIASQQSSCDFSQSALTGNRAFLSRASYLVTAAHIADSISRENKWLQDNKSCKNATCLFFFSPDSWPWIAIMCYLLLPS